MSFPSKLPVSTMFPPLTVNNNIGLTSKASEEIKRESSENCRFRQLHCRLTPPLRGIPANIPINLMSPETRVIGHIFVADSMGLRSFKFSWWAPKDACVLKQSV